MIESTWYEYLELIDTMTKIPGMYHLDNMRAELHKKLSEYYKRLHPDKFNQKRFDEVCHNLDKVVNFKPPLEPYDHIKPYVGELITRFSYQDLRNYTTDFISQLEYMKK